MEAAYTVFLMLTTLQDSNYYHSHTNESQRDENNPPETTSLTNNSILIQKCLVHLLNKERACVPVSPGQGGGGDALVSKMTRTPHLWNLHFSLGRH